MRSLHPPTASLESRYGELVMGLFASLLIVCCINNAMLTQQTITQNNAKKENSLRIGV